MYQLLGTHTFRFQTIDQDGKSKYWASKNSNPWEDLISVTITTYINPDGQYEHHYSILCANLGPVFETKEILSLCKQFKFHEENLF